MTKKIIINQIIKPCPYCRVQAKLLRKSVEFCNDSIKYFYVECPECKAATEQYNTYFGTFYHDRVRRLTEKEAIERAINDWNNYDFNIQTRLFHMLDEEKYIWHIEKLLSMVWYGAMISVDSSEYIRGW